MSRTRQTGLAAAALDLAEKAHAGETRIENLARSLEACGEDHSDCVYQAKLAVADLDRLYVRLLDLAAMILTADKAKAVSEKYGLDDAGQLARKDHDEEEENDEEEEVPPEKVAGKHTPGSGR